MRNKLCLLYTSGIVKTEFGYHLMFFVGSTPVWKESARSDLSNARANELLNSSLEKHTVEADFDKILLGYVEPVSYTHLA